MELVERKQLLPVHTRNMWGLIDFEPPVRCRLGTLPGTCGADRLETSGEKGGPVEAERSIYTTYVAEPGEGPVVAADFLLIRHSSHCTACGLP